MGNDLCRTPGYCLSPGLDVNGLGAAFFCPHQLTLVKI